MTIDCTPNAYSWEGPNGLTMRRAFFDHNGKRYVVTFGTDGYVALDYFELPRNMDTWPESARIGVLKP